MSINERSIDTTFTQNIQNFATYLFTSTNTIRIPTNVTITENIIVPKTCSLFFANGARFIHSTYSITFNGNIVGDPMWQIFEGTGSVIFTEGSVPHVRPEWWGVDYSADCTAALQKAINSVSSGGIVLLSASNYVVTGPLTNNTGAIIINCSNKNLSSLLPPSSFSREIALGGSLRASYGKFALGIETSKIANLSTNGYIKTSGGDGTLVVDTVGVFGPTGPQGNTGPIGLTGPQGETGLAGSTGPQGDTGFKGDTGPQGLTGQQGDTGLTGLTGPQGNTGLKGDTGPQGTTGPSGAAADKGETGVRGPTGPQGVTGPGAGSINHANLADMPDATGTNTDHDTRYVIKVSSSAPLTPPPFTGMAWMDLSETESDGMIVKVFDETSHAVLQGVSGKVNILGNSSSSISNNKNSGREILELRGKNSTSDGAGIDIFGNNDSTNPGKIIIYSNNTTSIVVDNTGKILKSEQNADSTNKWDMNTSSIGGSTKFEIVDADSASGNDKPQFWIERKHDGAWPGTGNSSTPVCLYAQHTQTGSNTASTHTLMSLAINEGTGVNTVIGFSGKAIKNGAGAGNAFGISASAVSNVIQNGGVAGLDVIIQQNVSGMISGDTLGGKWSSGLRIISNSNGSDARAAIVIDGGDEAYRFWNGILFDTKAFRENGSPITGTVAINMTSAKPQYCIKFGTATRHLYSLSDLKIETVNGNTYFDSSNENKITIRTANSAGIVINSGVSGSGNQTSYINFQNDTVLKGNIVVNEATVGMPLELNSSVSNDVKIASSTGFAILNQLKISNVKKGSTQEVAGAVAGEVWATLSHVYLPDNVLMLGV